MPNKMERFTQRARRILSRAQAAAEEFKHNYIGTEHMLLALFREEDGVAGRVLRDLGVEQRRVEELVDELTQATTRTANVALDLSPGTKRVLELAVDEARRMGHHYIGTEHLLLALVRQSDGVAIDVLKRLGVSPEEVRRQTRRILQEAPLQSSHFEAVTVHPPPIMRPREPMVLPQPLPLMEIFITKMLTMVDQNKLTIAQAAELLTAVQPNIILSPSEKSRLANQFNRGQGIGKRSLRVVISNIASHEVRLDLTLPLHVALGSVDAILAAVADNHIGRLWTEDIDTTNRIEVYIDEDASSSGAGEAEAHAE